MNMGKMSKKPGEQHPVYERDYLIKLYGVKHHAAACNAWCEKYVAAHPQTDESRLEILHDQAGSFAGAFSIALRQRVRNNARSDIRRICELMIRDLALDSQITLKQYVGLTTRKLIAF
jgi:hypothetical protein